MLGVLSQTYRFQLAIRRLFSQVEPPAKESQAEPSAWRGDRKPARQLHGAYLLWTVSVLSLWCVIIISEESIVANNYQGLTIYWFKKDLGSLEPTEKEAH